MRIILRTAILLPALLLTACIVFPHPHTLRPEASFLVLSDGQPLRDAEVILFSVANPYHRQLRRDVEVTDSTGSAHFGRLSSFEWGSLMIHGTTVMHWGWCVQHPGHISRSARPLYAGDFRGVVRVDMEPGNSEQCQDIGDPQLELESQASAPVTADPPNCAFQRKTPAGAGVSAELGC